MHYHDGSVYEGEWAENKRNGKGLLRLGLHSIYSYYLQLVCMQLLAYTYCVYNNYLVSEGIISYYFLCTCLDNGNRYEGSWKDNMKHGPGKFLYLNKGQVYTGFWIEDIAKNGALEDHKQGDISITDGPMYPIPEVCIIIIHNYACTINIDNNFYFLLRNYYLN